MSLFTTQFSGIGLIIDDQKFYKKRFDTDKTRIFWKCCKRSCRASAQTSSTFRLIQYQYTHNHESCAHEIANDRVRASLKRKVDACTSERPLKTIIREIIRESGLLGQTQIVCPTQYSKKELANFQKVMNRHKISIVGKSPVDIDDTLVALCDMKIKGEKIESSLIQDIDDVNKIVLLGTEDSLKELSGDIILGDGTFKTAARHFLQVYTLHVFRDGVYRPCAYFLLKDKLKLTYTYMLKLLSKKLGNLGVVFNPKHFILDFELGMIAAVRSSFPNCSIRGCNFHLGQSLKRKIEEKFAVEYTCRKYL